MADEHETRRFGAHPLTGAPLGRPRQAPSEHRAVGPHGEPLGKPGQSPSEHRMAGPHGEPPGRPGQSPREDPNRSQTGRERKIVLHGQAYVWPTERQPRKQSGTEEESGHL